MRFVSFGRDQLLRIFVRTGIKLQAPPAVESMALGENVLRKFEPNICGWETNDGTLQNENRPC